MKKILLIVIPIIVILLGVVLFLILSSKKTYTIKFDSNGGNVVSSQKVKDGDNAKEPDKPKRDEYVFVEWTYAGKGFNFNTLIESDLTLIAKWKKEAPDEFEITIDPKNGDEPTKIKILEEEKIEKPKDPTYKGYKFIGWVVDDIEYDFDKEVSKSFVLEAKWKKEYIISFDSNGGSKVSNQTVLEGDKIIKPANPVKEDNSFIEWQLNNNTFDFDTEITGNIKLKAKWKEINYVAYKSDSFNIMCYEQGTSTIASIVKTGDKIECSIDYEVDAIDQISNLSYLLKYGKGLKLVSTKECINDKNNKDKYSVTNQKPMSVGNAGKFVFEVLDINTYTNTPDFNINVSSIRFITNKNKYYSNKSLEVKHIAIWERMNSSNTYDKGKFTINCVDKNNNVIEEVKNGDVITCESNLEVNQGDEIKYLKYSFSHGSALERIKEEIPKGVNNVGSFHYMTNTPVSKLYLGKFTFKVKNVNDSDMLFVHVDGTFATKDGRYLTPKSIQQKFKNVWSRIDELKKAYREDNVIHIGCGTGNETPITIEKGQKFTCSTSFELYKGDDITNLKYNFKYGKGLKLINKENTNTILVGNNYRHTYNPATPVGTGTKFTFEIIDVDNKDELYVSIDSIGFKTVKNEYYSNSNVIEHVAK